MVEELRLQLDAAFLVEIELAQKRQQAIDQHFTQRNRFKDMEALKRAFPQLLGLGIDESTAAIVTGDAMQAVGKVSVHVYDRNEPAEGAAAYTKVSAGEKYDLKTKKKVK